MAGCSHCLSHSTLGHDYLSPHFKENTYLFKLDRENKAERIAVEVGAADGNMVEVTGMLKEGERVIIRGAERLESGQKVRLIG